MSAPIKADELLKPAKTAGELASYRKGYAAGLSAGKKECAALREALQTINRMLTGSLPITAEVKEIAQTALAKGGKQ